MPARMPRAAPYLFATTRMDDDWLEQIKDTRSVINKEHKDRCVNVLLRVYLFAVCVCWRLFFANGCFYNCVSKKQLQFCFSTKSL